jgi:hypothetical protein
MDTMLSVVLFDVEVDLTADLSDCHVQTQRVRFHVCGAGVMANFCGAECRR